MKIFLGNIPQNPYKYTKEQVDSGAASIYKIALKQGWDDCAESILSQLKPIEQVWVDKPDGEGWWWYRWSDSMICCHLFSNYDGSFYYYDHTSRAVFVNGSNGKWQKAILPKA